MAKKPRVIVLRTAGTNCNVETTFAFKESGALVDEVHLEELFKGNARLSDYHIMALPGGFSYGDDIASGRIFANELRIRLGQDIEQFIRDKKLIIGICNGFQILVKAGILPGVFNPSAVDHQTATLTNNDSGKFEARWVYLKVSGKSVWTEGLKDVIFTPVAHGEGKFIPLNSEVLKKLDAEGQVAFRYVRADGSPSGYPVNPNGSTDDIAGITDPTGRILGLMPHPERHFLFTQHPFWTRLGKKSKLGDGARVFENGVNYVKKNLL
ncbi:MAG: phosphoribosylformylglycinamidine synthase I [Candidatus Omnitrophica bacterium]|nr:phosphoribosylformylglycinamidine synthase I [Candidatus Omnitrophota bacterium]